MASAGGRGDRALRRRPAAAVSGAPRRTGPHRMTLTARRVDPTGAHRGVQSRSSSRIGSSRTRLPVAWNTALAIAAFMPTMPISPMPLIPSGLTCSSALRDQQHLHLRHVRIHRDVVFREVVVDVARRMRVDLGRLEQRRAEAPDHSAHILAVRGQRVDDACPPRTRPACGARGFREFGRCTCSSTNCAPKA